MRGHPRILDILRGVEDTAADHALVAGLLHVDPTTQGRIVEILLQRASDAGLTALPEVFDQLELPTRRTIIANTARLFSALRSSIRSPNAQTRFSTLKIIRESGNPRLAYLAALAVRDGAAKIRAEAASTLLHLARVHQSEVSQTTESLQDTTGAEADLARTAAATIRLLCEERKFLLDAIREGLDCFESHHRPEVLEAAMIFANELEGVLFHNNTLKRGKLTHAMLDILGTAPAQRFVAFVYVAMRYPELRRRIVSIISEYRNQQFFAEFIRYHWLALDPQISRTLIAIKRLAWFGDGFEPAFSLPPDVAGKAPSWVMALGLPMEQKIAILLNFILIDQPEANRAAVWALARLDNPAGTMALQSAVDHEDTVVRQIAERAIRFRERRDRRLTEVVQRGRSKEWSSLLNVAGLSEEFDDLWQHFDRLQPAQAKLAGPQVLEYVQGFAIQIQSKLLDPNPVERLRALRLLGAFHVTDRFSKDVFNLANDRVPEVRAAAMKALTHIADLTSRRILERATLNEIPLVQAAAIEALDQTGWLRNADLLTPMTDSQDASVRAAAVRALLRLRAPQGAVSLVAMLKESSIEHRCSALWIVDQLRLTAIAPRIAEIAQKDPDPRIARTAQQVLRRLERHKSAEPVEKQAVAKVPS